MTTIFKTIAGSRLYGTNTPESDTDYKAVHLPTKREILLGNRKPVKSYSTGQKDARNTSDDTDVESFELQRFLKLASDMQTIPVEMLFIDARGETRYFAPDPIWGEITANRNKILSNNPKSFVGYCKSQSVKYSMRGDRLKTFIAVCEELRDSGNTKTKGITRVSDVLYKLLEIDGVKYVVKEHNGKDVGYIDVFGRQVPETLSQMEALKVYEKPVREAGRRANDAMEAGGADLKALYHSVRIVDQGITLFRDGIIEFPAQNRDYLMKIRAGELEMDAILDHFDEKLEILEGIGDKSPLPAAPDYQWMDDFVAAVYEDIVRA